MSKNLKSSLKTWVAKIFKEENKNKRFLNDVANKITACQLKQSKNQLEDIIADDLYNKIEEIKLQKKEIHQAHKVIQIFLKDNQLDPSTKNQNFINQYLIGYFNNEPQQQINLNDLLPNVYNSLTHTYDCICPKTTKDLQVSQRTQICYRCKRECHTNCLWVADGKDDYECPLCFGCFCLPNRKVEQVLFGGYLRQTKKDKIEYKINLPLQFQLKQNQAVQVRCVRLGKDNRYELTWPQNCSVYINSKKIIQLKPLPALSSLKRRVDQELVLDKKILSNSNLLTIQEKRQYIEGSRIVNSQHHFVIVVLTKVLPSIVVQREFIDNKLTIQQSKQRLMQFMNRGSIDCLIQQIKVSLNCKFYSMKVRIPARSRHCRSHYQAFDLKNFILANNNSKNATQKWKCPLCKKRAYDLQVDDYLLNIITNNPQVQELYFDQYGTPSFKDPNKVNQTVQSSPLLINQQTHEKTQIFYIKKQNRTLSSPNDMISIDQNEPKLKQNFYECIQLDDTPEQIQNRKRGRNNFKRTYNSRVKNHTIVEESKTDTSKKKTKRDVESKTLVYKMSAEKQYSSSIQQIDSIKSHSDKDDKQSEYSQNQNQNRVTHKKNQKRVNNLRERVGVQKEHKQILKTFKTIAPSPSIRIVIPQAIRINETRLPQIKKQTIQQQTIEIIDEQQQTPQRIYQRKLQYKKNELQRYRLSMKDQNWSISQQEQKIFLGICEKFLLSMTRG